jgi:acetyltransferase-like isoleucine patch superfamily enzyme
MLAQFIKSILPTNYIARILSSDRIPGTHSKKNQANLAIGKTVSFGGNVFLFGTARIEIGDNTMIAWGVIIHTSTHDYNCHPMWEKRIDRPVKIGHDVWIGAGAIIMPGIVIGDYAVIGAGSVVTANVPDGAIVFGNPARIYKFRDQKTYLNKEPAITKHEDVKIVSGDYEIKNCKQSTF